MATGYLKVVVVDSNQTRIPGAQILVDHKGVRAAESETDSTGATPSIPLETVDKDLSLEANPDVLPFFLYQVTIRKKGYQERIHKDVTIFDGETSNLFSALAATNEAASAYYSGHMLSQHDVIPAQTIIGTPLLPTPIIPNVISVKLGTPQSDAEVITVDYIYYIKNVASSEIFPTWPEASLRANIYAIQSIALNRVYTEWYRQRGYDFQITSSTAFDQKFIPERVIYDSISTIVDEVYRQYVRRIGFIEPMFTAFCDGKQVVCDGLHQWETVDYANLGYAPLEILQHFYGDNIELATSAIIQDVAEGFHGPLSIGMAGPDVLLMQIYLLRISVNYPAIPQPFPLDGVFDDTFEESVREFQKIFNLPATGVIDRNTWYKIAFVYHGIKKSAELGSEGLISPVELLEFSANLNTGDFGTKVIVLQYALNVVAQYIPEVSRQPMDAKFGPVTKKNVENFQRHVGLPVTGSVDRVTWETLREYFEQVTTILPPSFEVLNFPGRHLTIGDTGLEVQTIQQYLNAIAKSYRTIPEIEPTGEYNETMANQVRAFQKEFNMNNTGIIDETTWNSIVDIYKAVLPVVLYPGFVLRYDDTNYYVAVLQNYLNTVAESYSNIPTSVVDEWFGPETLASVKAFQRQFGLNDDGIVGKKTWNKLLEVFTELKGINQGGLHLLT